MKRLRGLASAALCMGIAAAGIVPAGATANTSTTIGSWSVTRSGNAARVVWHSPRTLPFGAQELVVRHDGIVVGVAHERGTDAIVDISDAGASTLGASTLGGSALGSSGWELWRGDRRLDVADTSTPKLAAQARAKIAAAVWPTTARSNAPDPGKPGQYRSVRKRYAIGGFVWPEFPAPIETVGEATLPIGAPGARPLVLVLHGRHYTCFKGGPDGVASGDWPCQDGWKAIPSHLGYRVMTDLLASQGYIVVSIAANGISGQDYAAQDGGAAARSALIRRHLDLFAKWNLGGRAPWGESMVGRVDMNRVVLVGHSRGGEGVARAAIDSNRRDPWRIRGIVAIGPTAFGQQVPANVHTAVLLPYCDGDVSDLQGQIYVDGARDLLHGRDPSLRSAIMVMGANHNFFNREWTPGLALARAEDDWNYTGSSDDPVCGGNSVRRLKPEAQQAVGATYTAALVHFALDSDRTALAYLDGDAAAPASALGATAYAAAIGGARMALFEAGQLGSAHGSGSVRTQTCDGYSLNGEPTCSVIRSGQRTAYPHWIQSFAAPTAAPPKALRLEINGAGRATLRFAHTADVSNSSRIDLRLIADVVSQPLHFRVRLIDADGRSVEVGAQRTVTALPGSDRVGKDWAQSIRVNLHAVIGVDLQHLVALELVASAGNARGYLLDAFAVGETQSALPDVVTARVNVATVAVVEGDTPGITVNVPVTVDGDVTRDGSVWVTTTTVDGYEAFSLRVAPGSTHFSIPITYDGDTAAWGDRFVAISVVARSNVVTGAYLGGLQITDNEY